MSEGGFWDNPDSAQSVVSQLSTLKSVIEPVEEIQREVKDLAELFDLATQSDEDELGQLEDDLVNLVKKCEQIELQGLLCRPDDMKNCFFSIHAGAGGGQKVATGQMYTRYFERNKYKFQELDITPGEEVGVRSITLRVSGPFAFGKLSCETGVHRLVRISPFDSQSRRHTSFAAVDCIPEFDEDIDIEINDEDLRVDFYRASGAGGQHVNKTSSAVRITHSYVMQPYQMVKDHRTNFQTGNVAAVLDGELNGFIESYLRQRAKSGSQE